MPSLSGRRILITGASGFIGSHLTKRLQSAGAEVHGLSRSDRKGVGGTANWWRVDVQEIDHLRRVWQAVRPDVAYHLGGAVNGAPLRELLLPTYHSLLTTTVNVLQVAMESRCQRLVLAGTLEEADQGGLGHSPSSPYAAAKTAASNYARMCHDLFGLPAVILRTFMSYGPGQPDWKLVPSTIASLRRGVSPAVSSGLRQLDWIYIDDVVDAFAAAASAPGVEGMTLDVGTGRLTSVREVVELLCRLVNPAIEPRFGMMPDRPERPPRRASVGSTFEQLRWKAAITLEDGLALTVAALRRAP